MEKSRKIEWTRVRQVDAEALIDKADKLFAIAEKIMSGNPLRPSSFAVHDLGVAMGEFKDAKLRFEGFIG